MKKLNMRYTLTLLIALCAVTSETYAQQIPLYSQYYFTKFIYNPAFAGDQGNLEANLIGRRQWDGVSGYETNAFTLSGAPQNTNVGLGLHVVNDQNNLVRTNSVYGSYAYRLKMGKNSMLAMGMALGMIDTRFNTDNIVVTDYNDPIIPIMGQKGGPVIDANFGITMQAGGFQLGLSLPQAFAGRQTYKDNYETVINHDLMPHFVGTASFDIWLSPDKFKMQPLVMYKSVKNAPAQIDGNLMFDWINKGWFSAGYRDEYAVTLSAGVQVGSILRVGYSYDHSIHEQSAALGRTHELMLGISLDKKKDVREDEERKRAQAERARQAVRDSINDERFMELSDELDELKKTGGKKDTVVIVQKIESVRTEPAKTDKPGEVKKDDGVPGTGKFMVVAGSFSNERNANRYVNQLKKQGHSAAVFKAPNGQHYVHLGRFDDKDVARKVVSEKKTAQLQLWVKTLN